MNKAKTIKTRVSKPKPVTGKPSPDEKHLVIEPAIILYYVDDYDESDRE